MDLATAVRRRVGARGLSGFAARAMVHELEREQLQNNQSLASWKGDCGQRADHVPWQRIGDLVGCGQDIHCATIHSRTADAQCYSLATSPSGSRAAQDLVFFARLARLMKNHLPLFSVFALTFDLARPLALGLR